VLGQALAAVPYVLVVSAASFIYIAIADLMPDLHRTSDSRGKAWQVVLIAAGVATIAVPHLLRFPH
jgi:zinc and cadmium transporter